MTRSRLRRAVLDLERTGQLIRISDPVDPHLEMAEIHRRVHRAGGPAVFYERVKGSPFPAVSNLFGTIERARFVLRKTLRRVETVIAAKADPTTVMKNPLRGIGAGLTALTSIPRPALGSAPTETTTISQLPQIVSWPDDGGPFVLLPQVSSEDPTKPGPFGVNVGMYRIQLGGNDYVKDREVGLHFQIHRGMGVHYTKAAERGEALRVSVAVGGPPAHTLAAVMPLPEGLSEWLFAGMLAGRGFRTFRPNGVLASAEADFVIVGRVQPGKTKPEGPFGDHLGYYAKTHEFPVLDVEAVYHQRDAVWPFTIVGRPPQEDSVFGTLIHDLTGPLVPTELPGLVEMHAVDSAGVHPLMLAVGHERYTPYSGTPRPQELLTIANSILGFGQASLAKVLVIANHADDPNLDCSDERHFFEHILRRVDWKRDLHFQTNTTIDTLDYSGTDLNQGSKLVVAAVGPPVRDLAKTLPTGTQFPEPIRNAAVAFPGVLCVSGPEWSENGVDDVLNALESRRDALAGFPLIALSDDADFAAESVSNWLWTTFTRMNPSHDVHGLGAKTVNKHWGCDGSLVIDARRKPWHAPPLLEDAEVTARVDRFFQSGGPLAAWG